MTWMRPPTAQRLLQTALLEEEEATKGYSYNQGLWDKVEAAFEKAKAFFKHS